MFHEVTLTRVVVDKKGNDKTVTEKYFTENLVYLAESEVKALELYTYQCDVTCVKQSSLREFINGRTDEEECIYTCTLESIFTDEDTGEEKTTKYVVGVFSKSVEDATKEVKEYMNQGLEDLRLVAIKRTKYCDVLKR